VATKAPGRICFAGEDLDWMGGSVILGAITRFIQVTVVDADDMKIHVSCNIEESELSFYPNEIDTLQKKLVETPTHFNLAISTLYFFSKLTMQTLVPMRIKMHSEFPSCAGLSSSATSIVGLLKGLFAYYKEQVSGEQICTHAFYIEKELAGRNVGKMDYYPVVFSGIQRIRFNGRKPEYEHIRYRKLESIIIADTRQTRSTSSVIKNKQRLFVQGEKAILEYQRKTEECVYELYELIQRNGDIHAFGEIINRCHELMRDKLLVSTELVEKCVETCLKKGAVGAKLTGAGLGGCIVAFTPNSKAKEVSAALSHYPVDVFQTSIYQFAENTDSAKE
jgi:mevalonate kinase